MRETRVVTIRGMPEGWRKQMEKRRSKDDLSKSAVYSAAFDGLSSAIEEGRRIREFPVSAKTKGYSVKLPREVVDRADRAIEANGPPAKKSRFAREAVRMFLEID